MKIIKTIRGAALGFVAATLTITASQSEIIYPSLDDNKVREQVVLATDRVESRIQDAQKLINEARSKALQGTITSAHAVKVIKEQNALITKLENELKIKLDQAIETVKAADQDGYFASFVSNAQDLGSRALAPFKSGYRYTQQQKTLATKVIEGLVEQQEQLTRDYEQALTDRLASIERATLQKRYETIIAGLNNEIYQQQLITGAVMSIERKLFWAAVAAGAAVAGVYFLAPQAAITPEIVKEIEGALLSEPTPPVEQEKIEPSMPVVESVVRPEKVVTEELQQAASQPTITTSEETNLSGNDRVSAEEDSNFFLDKTQESVKNVEQKMEEMQKLIGETLTTDDQTNDVVAEPEPTTDLSADTSTAPSDNLMRDIELQEPTLAEVMTSAQEQETSPVQEQESNLLENLQDDITIEGDAGVTGYKNVVEAENQPIDQLGAEQKISDSDVFVLPTESSVHTLTDANELVETLPGESGETAMQVLDDATTNDAGANQEVWSWDTLDNENNIEPANELPAVLEPEISMQESIEVSGEAALPTQEPEIISEDSAGLLQELDNDETQLTSHNPIKRK